MISRCSIRIQRAEQNRPGSRRATAQHKRCPTIDRADRRQSEPRGSHRKRIHSDGSLEKNVAGHVGCERRVDVIINNWYFTQVCGDTFFPLPQTEKSDTSNQAGTRNVHTWPDLARLCQAPPPRSSVTNRLLICRQEQVSPLNINLFTNRLPIKYVSINITYLVLISLIAVSKVGGRRLHSSAAKSCMFRNASNN